MTKSVVTRPASLITIATMLAAAAAAATATAVGVGKLLSQQTEERQ